MIDRFVAWSAIREGRGRFPLEYDGKRFNCTVTTGRSPSPSLVNVSWESDIKAMPNRQMQAMLYRTHDPRGQRFVLIAVQPGWPLQANIERPGIREWCPDQRVPEVFCKEEGSMKREKPCHRQGFGPSCHKRGRLQVLTGLEG